VAEPHQDLLGKDEETDEEFTLHVGEVGPEDLLEEFAERALMEEEALELELEEQFGVAGSGPGGPPPG